MLNDVLAWVFISAFVMPMKCDCIDLSVIISFMQLYKQNVHSVVADFIPLIMNTIILQPSLTAR